MNLMETILSGGKEWSRVTKKTKPKKNPEKQTEDREGQTNVISGDLTVRKECICTDAKSWNGISRRESKWSEIRHCQWDVRWEKKGGTKN